MIFAQASAIFEKENGIFRAIGVASANADRENLTLQLCEWHSQSVSVI